MLAEEEGFPRPIHKRFFSVDHLRKINARKVTAFRCSVSLVSVDVRCPMCLAVGHMGDHAGVLLTRVPKSKAPGATNFTRYFLCFVLLVSVDVRCPMCHAVGHMGRARRCIAYPGAQKQGTRGNNEFADASNRTDSANRANSAGSALGATSQTPLEQRQAVLKDFRPSIRCLRLPSSCRAGRKRRPRPS